MLAVRRTIDIVQVATPAPGFRQLTNPKLNKLAEHVLLTVSPVAERLVPQARVVGREL